MVGDSSNPEVQEFLERVFDRFKESEEAYNEWRRDALSDQKFYHGDQWEGAARRRRQRNKQPILTINRLPQFKNLVTNEIRQQRPSILLSPVSDATVASAQMLQGVIRDIEYQSNAGPTYDLGTDQMVVTGLGYALVINQYRPGKTFDQRVVIKPIKNQFAVYDDPNCEELDRSDRRYCFIVADMTKEEFKAKYGEKATWRAAQGLTSVGDNPKMWLKEGGVRVAQYFYIVEEESTLYELKDGRIMDKVDDSMKDEVVQDRKVTMNKVKWAKLSACDVLQEADIPCAFIPIVAFIGEEMNENGRINFKGLIRDAKDPQRQYNYWKTATTTTLAIASKAPYRATPAQLQGHEDQWKTAHIDDPIVLYYNPVTEGNQLVPAPERDVAEPGIQGMVQLMAGATQDLMAATGLNDASLGERRPDEAAKAVLMRQRQGNLSTLHYSDNVARAVKFTGKLVLSFLQMMREKPRVARSLANDGTSKTVIVHNGDEDGAVKLKSEASQMLDLNQGIYDVQVSMGSFETKRQETVESILSLINSAPAVLNVVGDLLVGNMDWPGAKEIAQRLKKMLPPQLQDDPDQETDPDQRAEMLKSQLQQMMQQLQQLQQALQQAQLIITTKQIEANSRERVAAINAGASMISAEFKANAAVAQAQLSAELDALNARYQLLMQPAQNTGVSQ